MPFKPGNKVNLTHGKCWTTEYNAWLNMKARCYNTNFPQYWDYGGRGIEVENYLRYSFENFLNYIGLKPGPEYTLERINNNENYERGNIKWATRSEQQHNTRKTNRKLKNKDLF